MKLNQRILYMTEANIILANKTKDTIELATKLLIVSTQKMYVYSQIPQQLNNSKIINTGNQKSSLVSLNAYPQMQIEIKTKQIIKCFKQNLEQYSNQIYTSYFLLEIINKIIDKRQMGRLSIKQPMGLIFVNNTVSNSKIAQIILIKQYIQTKKLYTAAYCSIAWSKYSEYCSSNGIKVNWQWIKCLQNLIKAAQIIQNKKQFFFYLRFNSKQKQQQEYYFNIDPNSFGITDNQEIQINSFKILMTSLIQIPILRLSFKIQTNVGLTYCARFLSNCKPLQTSLKILILKGCGITNTILAQLSTIISGQAFVLEEINLQKNQLKGQSCFQILTKVNDVCKRIKKYWLGGNLIEIGKKKNTQSINQQNNFIQGLGSSHIKNNNNKHHGRDTFIVNISQNNDSNVNKKTSTWQIFLKSLISSVQIDLSCNHIGDEGLQILEKTVFYSQNPPIKKLVLVNNQFSKFGLWRLYIGNLKTKQLHQIQFQFIIFPIPFHSQIFNQKKISFKIQYIDKIQNNQSPILSNLKKKIGITLNRKNTLNKPLPSSKHELVNLTVLRSRLLSLSQQKSLIPIQEILNISRQIQSKPYGFPSSIIQEINYMICQRLKQAFFVRDHYAIQILKQSARVMGMQGLEGVGIKSQWKQKFDRLRQRETKFINKCKEILNFYKNGEKQIKNNINNCLEQVIHQIIRFGYRGSVIDHIFYLKDRRDTKIYELISRNYNPLQQLEQIQIQQKGYLVHLSEYVHLKNPQQTYAYLLSSYTMILHEFHRPPQICRYNNLLFIQTQDYKNMKNLIGNIDFDGLQKQQRKWQLKLKELCKSRLQFINDDFLRVEEFEKKFVISKKQLKLNSLRLLWCLGIRSQKKQIKLQIPNSVQQDNTLNYQKQIQNRKIRYFQNLQKFYSLKTTLNKKNFKPIYNYKLFKIKFKKPIIHQKYIKIPLSFTSATFSQKYSPETYPNLRLQALSYGPYSWKNIFLTYQDKQVISQAVKLSQYINQFLQIICSLQLNITEEVARSLLQIIKFIKTCQFIDALLQEFYLRILFFQKYKNRALQFVLQIIPFLTFYLRPPRIMERYVIAFLQKNQWNFTYVPLSLQGFEGEMERGDEQAQLEYYLGESNYQDRDWIPIQKNILSLIQTYGKLSIQINFYNPKIFSVQVTIKQTYMIKNLMQILTNFNSNLNNNSTNIPYNNQPQGSFSSSSVSSISNNPLLQQFINLPDRHLFWIFRYPGSLIKNNNGNINLDISSQYPLIQSVYIGQLCSQGNSSNQNIFSLYNSGESEQQEVIYLRRRVYTPYYKICFGKYEKDILNSLYLEIKNFYLRGDIYRSEGNQIQLACLMGYINIFDTQFKKFNNNSLNGGINEFNVYLGNLDKYFIELFPQGYSNSSKNSRKQILKFLSAKLNELNLKKQSQKDISKLKYKFLEKFIKNDYYCSTNYIVGFQLETIYQDNVNLNSINQSYRKCLFSLNSIFLSLVIYSQIQQQSQGINPRLNGLSQSSFQQFPQQQIQTIQYIYLQEIVGFTPVEGGFWIRYYRRGAGKHEIKQYYFSVKKNGRSEHEQKIFILQILQDILSYMQMRLRMPTEYLHRVRQLYRLIHRNNLSLHELYDLDRLQKRLLQNKESINNLRESKNIYTKQSVTELFQKIQYLLPKFQPQHQQSYTFQKTKFLTCYNTHPFIEYTLNRQPYQYKALPQNSQISQRISLQLKQNIKRQSILQKGQNVEQNKVINEELRVQQKSKIQNVNEQEKQIQISNKNRVSKGFTRNSNKSGRNQRKSKRNE